MDEPLILDRYRLIERLAAGGSAEVWRARDEQLDRPVAVKRLHPHLLPDPASRERLGAEARAAASLSHPVIVGVYDVDTTGESPALVMELVEGESLGARIDRDGPLPAREAAAITADLAEALFHAHQRGVIHRDVKPGNVLLARDGRTRLVDFGIAHSLADAAARLTLTGTVVGTLQAMAPEQLAGGPITPRTDLYGLGVVLHQALTGRPPFPSGSPLALAEAQRTGVAPLEDVDPALDALVAACLAPDPTARPLHAGALAAALRDWLAGDPSAALAMRPPAPPPSATDAITQQMPVAAPRVAAAPVPGARTAPVARPAAPSARPRRAGLLVAAIGLLLVIGLVAVGMAALGDRSATGTPSDGPSVAPSTSSTAPPAWMAELTAAIEAACGPDAAELAVAEMQGMAEPEARDHAAEVIAACGEPTGGGNDKKGKGNGKGNGRGGGG